MLAFQPTEASNKLRTSITSNKWPLSPDFAPASSGCETNRKLGVAAPAPEEFGGQAQRLERPPCAQQVGASKFAARRKGARHPSERSRRRALTKASHSRQATSRLVGVAGNQQAGKHNYCTNSNSSGLRARFSSRQSTEGWLTIGGAAGSLCHSGGDSGCCCSCCCCCCSCWPAAGCETTPTERSTGAATADSTKLAGKLALLAELGANLIRRRLHSNQSHWPGSKSWRQVRPDSAKPPHRSSWAGL